jgi:hypothetical protein
MRVPSSKGLRLRWTCCQAAAAYLPRRIAVWGALVVTLLRGEGDELAVVGGGVAGGDAGEAVGEGDSAVSVGLPQGDGQCGCGVRGEGKTVG